MKCAACGSTFFALRTDLPFKLGNQQIVIIKDIPVLQCRQCPDYALEDPVLERVEVILQQVVRGVELEMVRFAA